MTQLQLQNNDQGKTGDDSIFPNFNDWMAFMLILISRLDKKWWYETYFIAVPDTNYEVSVISSESTHSFWV